LEVVTAVRKRLGEDFPVLLRISVEEMIKGGYSVTNIKSILPDLVSAGVDVIHASVGTHGSPGGITSATAEYGPGWNVWRAREIKQTVDIPVIAVGRFVDPALADAVIARGDADMVAFGRQILADPDFLRKAREGRSSDIRRCLACNQGCIERLMLEAGSKIRCAINPETGQELIYPTGPASTSRRVWIIGGGPAGLTAAHEAARLGHEVTLFEKDMELGGQVRFAGQAPYKKGYADWVAWLAEQVERKGVKIHRGTEVNEAMLAAGDAEVVILAAGAEKIVPPIEGLDHPMVCDPWQVLDGRVPPGRKAVVVGGGLIGMETADFLIEHASEVVLVEMLTHSPVMKITGHGYHLHKRLRDARSRLLFNTTVERITGDAVILVHQGKREEITGVDQVIVAVGMKPRDGLKDDLQANGIRHFVVGDANRVRRIIEATEEGAKAAWEI
jgi:NADPH-dependent 2,4-dienoyl-CoA reductase/sulfur reductase-like enzyme